MSQEAQEMFRLNRIFVAIFRDGPMVSFKVQYMEIANIRTNPTWIISYLFSLASFTFGIFQALASHYKGNYYGFFSLMQIAAMFALLLFFVLYPFFRKNKEGERDINMDNGVTINQELFGVWSHFRTEADLQQMRMLLIVMEVFLGLFLLIFMWLFCYSKPKKSFEDNNGITEASKKS